MVQIGPEWIQSTFSATAYAFTYYQQPDAFYAIHSADKFASPTQVALMGYLFTFTTSVRNIKQTDLIG